MKNAILFLFALMFASVFVGKTDGLSGNEGLKLNVKSLYAYSNGLVNYWPFNSHIQDVIGGAHLFNGTNAGLTSDQFERPLSALNLNKGFYQIPAGNFFPNDEFTLSLWVLVRQIGLRSSMVTFFNGPNFFDLFRLGFWGTSLNPQLIIFYGIEPTVNQLTSPIALNTWTHLAVSFESKNFNLKIYTNSILTATLANLTLSFKKTTRLFNYIGRGASFPTDQDLDGKIDELKLFNRALTPQEIQDEMNVN